MLLKIFTLSFIILFTSCSSSKNTNQEAKSNTMSNNTIDFETDNQMMDEGYNIGKIKYQENSKCEYLIVDETTNVKFDPINISEEIYTTFRKDTQKVYFKYRPLRMKNRCLEGQPIQITDIKKREG